MRRALLAMWAAALLVAVAASGTAALTEAVTFGAPAAQATFTAERQALEFRQPVTLASPPTRVEILLEFPDALGPYVREVAPPSGTGEQTLVLDWDFVEDGHLVPNTAIAARWRLTFGQGDAAATSEGPAVRVVIRDERFRWRTLEGEFVRLHWYEGSDSFAKRALAVGDDAVRDATALFGVDDWSPVDFFVYATTDDFYVALGPGTPENVGGQAHADIRTMFAQIAPGDVDDPWVADVIPHELAHLVFATTVRNDYHTPPRWLNEGLAVYLSVGYTPSWRAITEEAVRDGTLLPLHALVDQFPTTATLFYQAYGVSASAVDYLVRTHGREAMVALVRSYATGLSDDEAFEAAIGVDVAAFEAAWLADLGASLPTRHGPVPAPTGPQPPGWDASPAPGGTLTPGVASPSASARPTATPAPLTPAGEGDETVILVAAVAVALVAALALVAWLGRSRRDGPTRGGPAADLPAAPAPEGEEPGP